MDNGKRILVTFGRSDPLHLTEATHEMLGEGPDYLWGPEFGRPKPPWAWELIQDELGYSLYDEMVDYYDVVYCGHGATLLEATAAGCEVMVLTTYQVGQVGFRVAWTGVHLDHSGLPVEWWVGDSMFRMHREIVNRRFPPPTRGVEGSGGRRGGETGVEGGVWAGGASWVHQGA